MCVLGFSRSEDCKGELIRAATGGNWNHCWIGYEDPDWGGRWVAHAISKGVCIQRAELLLEEYDESECYRVAPSLDIDTGMRANRNHVNEKYDFKAVIINGLWLAIYRTTHLQLFDPVVNPNKISCSEFIIMLLQGASYAPVAGLQPDLVPPDCPETSGPEHVKGLHQYITEDPATFTPIDFAAWVHGSP